MGQCLYNNYKTEELQQTITPHPGKALGCRGERRYEEDRLEKQRCPKQKQVKTILQESG